jgi:hypothetical protein
MRQVRAVKAHTYGNKFRKVGDVYTATDRDANLMVLVKNSEYHAEEPVAPVVVAPEPKPKRPYVRRDMSAGKVGGYNRKDLIADAE